MRALPMRRVFARRTAAALSRAIGLSENPDTTSAPQPGQDNRSAPQTLYGTGGLCAISTTITPISPSSLLYSVWHLTQISFVMADFRERRRRPGRRRA